MLLLLAVCLHLQLVSSWSMVLLYSAAFLTLKPCSTHFTHNICAGTEVQREYVSCDSVAVGYKIKLIMPADQSEERKSAMAAFGAELISVPSSSDGGGMEAARDLAARMQVSHCLEGYGTSSCVTESLCPRQRLQMQNLSSYLHLAQCCACVQCCSGTAAHWLLACKGLCSTSASSAWQILARHNVMPGSLAGRTTGL